MLTPHPARPSALEPLEARRLFAFTDIVVEGDPSEDLFGAGDPGLALPRGPIELPRPDTGAAGSGQRDQAAAAVSLVGSYRGGAQLTGVGGGVRLNVDLTRQRRGVVTGSLRLPALDTSLAGSATVTFTGNRRFTFQLTQGSDHATVTGRLNRDDSLTGEVDLVTDGIRRNGVFAVSRRAGLIVVA